MAMRLVSVASLALLLTVCLTACSASTGESASELLCPGGWIADAYSDGGCRPSDAVVAQNRASLTSGVVGFARLTTGVCGLCTKCSCNTRLVENLEVQALVADDLDLRRPPCSRLGLPPLPLARTTTDANGLYSFRLAPGSYVVVADDPAVDERNRCAAVRPVTVESDVVTAALVFDHGVY